MLDRVSPQVKPLPVLPGGMPNYWVFGVLSENKKRDLLTFREQGYYASGVHLPNSFYSVFGSSLTLKGVKEFNNKFFAIPCGWWMNHV